jgi:hypothetical protein
MDAMPAERTTFSGVDRFLGLLVKRTGNSL